jgi:hypothetical protein
MNRHPGVPLRVLGFFLRVDDFDDAYVRMVSGGVEFVSPARTEEYGRVAVFSTSRATAGIYLAPPGGVAEDDVCETAKPREHPPSSA